MVGEERTKPARDSWFCRGWGGVPRALSCADFENLWLLLFLALVDTQKFY